MRITPEVLQDEFIGLHAKAARSRNRSCIGIAGKVIDETKNTIVIIHDNKEKTMVKNETVFHFKFPDGTVVEIDGKTMIGRPEDRVKRKIRRRW
ncbi:MAG: ribonuclease P protein component 1 [Candidatus Bathyarchaeota archaeon]|nr:ribonuclease P protein component 1 [Candidatus Bathyarchaeota archaeon]